MAEISDRPAPHGVKTSLLITFSERLVSILVMFLVTAVTARLMQPADFAIVAIGVSIQFVAMTLLDFGISNYLVQKKQLATEDVRTGFTICASIAILLSALLIAIAMPLERFLGLPGLGTFLMVLSAATIVSPVMVPPVALIRRDQRFDQLALFNLGVSVTNAATLLTLAVLGFGHLSFAWAVLAAAAVGCMLSLIIRFDLAFYRPCFTGWRAATSFGCWSALIDMMGRTQDLVTNLILGRALSPDLLGLMNRAALLATLPQKLLAAGVANVAISGYAAAAREGSDLKALYLRALMLLCCLLWPASLLLALLAEPFTLLMLGREWSGAVGLVAILASTQLFAASFMLAVPVMVAAGAVRRFALMTVASVGIGALALAAVAGAGPLAAAWVIAAVTAVQSAATYLMTQRVLGFSHGDAVRALRPSLISTLAAMAGPALVLTSTGFQASISVAGAIGIVATAIAGWLAALALTRHPLWLELRSASTSARAAWLRASAQPRGS